ncbi:hypothetical protein NC651_012731 [Populus alba x Populus x berolinensis]|nr:hypothetical protein NC651_012731 [Populus alba x Populus x berolinensis]
MVSTSITKTSLETTHRVSFMWPPSHLFTPLFCPILSSSLGTEMLLTIYVNHQFYTDKVRSPKGYLAASQLRASQFDKDKLLPSYEVNGRGAFKETHFLML